MKLVAPSRENKSVVAVQHRPYLGACERARTRAARDLPKGDDMVKSYLHTEFLPLEERIRRAGAERSVELGYRIGDAIARISHAVTALFTHRTPVGRLAHRH
jgi:hypothetical protein